MLKTGTPLPREGLRLGSQVGRGASPAALLAVELVAAHAVLGHQGAPVEVVLAEGTFLVCDGAEVSVAGQGGCRLLGNEAAQGRPAPCQAPHGPRLHATPTAGCALRPGRGNPAGTRGACSCIQRVLGAGKQGAGAFQLQPGLRQVQALLGGQLSVLSGNVLFSTF